MSEEIFLFWNWRAFLLTVQSSEKARQFQNKKFFQAIQSFLYCLSSKRIVSALISLEACFEICGNFKKMSLRRFPTYRGWCWQSFLFWVTTNMHIVPNNHASGDFLSAPSWTRVIPCILNCWWKILCWFINCPGHDVSRSLNNNARK